MTHLRIGALALVAGTVLLGSAPASAVESYDSCTGFIDALPAVIGTQGTWCLRKDLATGVSSGNAITVNANNVTIDCNGFKLGGLAAGPATLTRGIYASNRLNLTVRHCNLRGFNRGAVADAGGGHVFEDNRFDGNTVMGLFVSSAGNITVRRNEVFDTGGAPGGLTSYGILVAGSSACAITDNTVAGVQASLAEGFTGSFTYGLQVVCAGAELRANRVTGLAFEGDGGTYGILTTGEGNRIVDNFVHGSGVVLAGTGISGDGALTLCQGNVVTGMLYGIQACAQDGNHVLPSPP